MLGQLSEPNEDKAQQHNKHNVSQLEPITPRKSITWSRQQMGYKFGKWISFQLWGILSGVNKNKVVWRIGWIYIQYLQFFFKKIQVRQI